jgi:hypothetical protein
MNQYRMANRRRKVLQLYAFIAIFLLAAQLVPALDSENDALSDFEIDEAIVDIDNPPEVPEVTVAEISTESSIHDSTPQLSDDGGDKMEAELTVVEDVVTTLSENVETSEESPVLKTDDEDEGDNIMIEAAVSSLGESVSSKVTSIANRIKGLAISKQNVKKLAAAGLGAWGAATGVGWAMQHFGGGKKLLSK